MKKTFRYADLISYPSSRLRDYISKLGGEASRGVVIPHIGYACTGGTSAETFHLLHAGKLGASELTERSPRPLLGGLARFLMANEAARSITKLSLVGPKDETAVALVEKLALGNIVKHLGSVNYEQSLRKIGFATICVLVEADGSKGFTFPPN